MDMNKLLSNLDSIEKGTFDGPVAQDKSEMKAILESLQSVTLSENPIPGAMGAPSMPEPEKVTMNVNMTAQGTDGIADLLKLMGAASTPEEAPMSMPMPMPAKLPAPDTHDDEMGDMKKMMKISTDGPEVEEAMDGEITKDSVKKSALDLLVDIAKTSKQYKGEVTDDQIRYLGSLVHDFDMAGIETEKYSEIEKLFRTASKTNKADMSMIQPAYAQAKELDEEAVEKEDYANEPDEEYADTQTMTRDLAGGLNREKPKSTIRVKDPAVESIKSQLWAALNEKKSQ